MINCPKDRMFIIILDNGKRLPAVYVSERECLVVEGYFSIFGNDGEDGIPHDFDYTTDS